MELNVSRYNGVKLNTLDFDKRVLIVDELESLLIKLFPSSKITIENFINNTLWIVSIYLLEELLFLFNISFNVSEMKICINNGIYTQTLYYETLPLNCGYLQSIESAVKKFRSKDIVFCKLNVLLKEYNDKHDKLLKSVVKLKEVTPEILHDDDTDKLLNNLYNHLSAEKEYDKAHDRFTNQNY